MLTPKPPEPVRALIAFSRLCEPVVLATDSPALMADVEELGSATSDMGLLDKLTDGSLIADISALDPGLYLFEGQATYYNTEDLPTYKGTLRPVWKPEEAAALFQMRPPEPGLAAGPDPG